jgi:hypothetical protein
MKLAWWMLAGSVVSSFIMAALLGAEIKLEVWLGMLGPLTAALVSWIAMERQHVRRPEGLTAVLIKAFAAKVIFFGGYITVLVRLGLVRPIPFVVSFIIYFLALHVVEVIGLYGFQAAGPMAPSGVLPCKLLEMDKNK